MHFKTALASGFTASESQIFQTESSAPRMLSKQYHFQSRLCPFCFRIPLDNLSNGINKPKRNEYLRFLTRACPGKAPREAGFIPAKPLGEAGFAAEVFDEEGPKTF